MRPLFLTVCLSILISGCGGLTVKHVNPNEPNALESNERVVFGRVIFITHSEETGEVSFPPCGLGLFHVETEKRARRVAFLSKSWFEGDGTFFWVLPAGSYRIDALGWGFERNIFRSAPDPKKPRKDQVFSLKPDTPPECGFVVSPNVNFTVTGDSDALYLGSLLIDTDIKKEYGIEVKNINLIEIRDEYNDAMKLLKSRYPEFSLAVKKRLMTIIPDRPVPVANGHCPTGFEVFMRGFMQTIFIPKGGYGFSPSINIPSFGIGK